MLTIYRRHEKACPHRTEGRKYRRCRCPIHVQGTLTGQHIRKSTGLRDWERAQDLVRQWEVEGQEVKPAEDRQRMTLCQAWDRFLIDAEARKLHASTVSKYKLLSRQMRDFGERRGLRYLGDFDLDVLSAFRAEWTEGPRTTLKKLERLRAFLRFCEHRRWIDSNPASELKPPKIRPKPTLPFRDEEMLRVLAAIETYAERAGRANAERLRAFVLLLRYSGMRIGDAVQLSIDHINGNRLFLYTQKTGVPVNCVLPDFAVRALDVCRRSSDRYFFWTGRSTLHTAVGVWQRSLQTLFGLAKISGGHAHRFRDTFAVELLLAGVPLERVSVLLGHQSIRVTERHYAPWTRSRQEQIEADLERVWSCDPIAFVATKGTQEVRSGKRVVN